MSHPRRRASSEDDAMSTPPRDDDMTAPRPDELDDGLLPLPAWAAALPSPLRAVVDFTYLSLRRRDDTPIESIRKLTLSVYLIVGIVSLVRAGTSVAALAKPESISKSDSAVAVATAILPFTFFAAFTMVKLRPRLNALAADLPLLANVVYAGLVTLAQPNALMYYSIARLMAALVLLASPRTMICVALSTIVYFVSAYNEARSVAHAAPGEPADLIAFSDAAIQRDFTDRMVHHVVSFITFALILYFLAKVRATAEQFVIRARATLDVATAIAAALSAYDTKEARRQLAAARADGIADARLLDRFDAIVENLEQYRPHLPNWLLPADIPYELESDVELSEAVDPNGGFVGRLAEFGASSAHDDSFGGASKSADAMPSGSEAGSRAGFITVLRPPRDSTLNTPTNGENAALAAPITSRPDRVTPRVTARGVGGDAHGSRTTRPGSSVANPLSGPLQMQLNPFRSKTVLGHVGYRVARNGQSRGRRTGAENMAAIAAATNAFVDRVHALASATGAAVHSFVGDTAAVTWGAVTAVAAQPEAQAARFMARLRQDAGHALVTAWGALAAGNARVQLAGAAGPQRAVTVSVEFAEAAERLLALARRHRAFVCDGAVHDGARHAVELRGIGVVRIDADAFDEDAEAGSAQLPPAGPLVPAPNSPTGPGGNGSAYAAGSANLERSGRKATAPAALPVFEILRERHHQAAGNTDGALDHFAAATDGHLCVLAVAVAEGDRDSALGALAALAAAGSTTDVLARDAMLTELVHEAAALVPAV